jgi:2-oxo-3-hexenedioate decarboxylase
MQADTAALARHILDMFDAGTQIGCLTDRLPDLDLRGGYAIGAEVHRLRLARGEVPVGRKLGFTNRTIWEEYNVHAPIWAPIYNTTVQPLPHRVSLSALLEPRIEPEIILRLSRAPRPGMSPADLMGCVGHVAHGFELVQSLYPAWAFRAADTVAALGLHGALLHGPFLPVGPDERETWRAALSDFTIRLSRDGAVMDEGHSANVMGGGPLDALGHLVDLLAEDGDAQALGPGDIVTTGTLTRAFPVAPGEFWSTALHGLDLPGITIAFFSGRDTAPDARPDT